MNDSADPLSEVLEALRVNAVIFCKLTGGTGWGLAVPELDAVSVHLMVAGRCHVVADGLQLQLDAGDIGILRDGPAQVIGDPAGSSPTPLPEVVAAMARAGNKLARLGPSPAVSEVICGAFYLDRRVFGPLLDFFPAAFKLERRTLAGRLAPALVAGMAADLERPKPGGAAVLRQLGALLFVEIVRAAVDQRGLAERVAGWAGALHSPSLQRVLQAMHAEVARRWTLDELAKIAGLSRSAFTAKFREVVGASPMEYLARWRVLRGASLLEGTTMSVAEVATAVGYASDTAFTKAFKSATGTPPASYRSTAAQRRSPRVPGGA